MNMKVLSDSQKNENRIEISIKEPIVILRNLNDSTKPLNPTNLFDGLYVHYPLQPTQVHNNDLILNIDAVFITFPNKNKWFFQSINSQSQVITICLPWDWLYLNFNHSNYSIFKKKNNLDIILTSVKQIHQLAIIPKTKKLFLKNSENLLELLNIVFHEFTIKQNRNKVNKQEISGFDKEVLSSDSDKITFIYKKYVLNPQSKIPTIAELAAEINIKPEKLKRVFKEVYGKPIYACHSDIKFNYAMQLLQEGHKVSDVSEVLCYTQISKFVSTFKKKYNTTPGIIKMKAK